MHTIFPDAKMRAVVLGSRIRMMTAENRLGLKSQFFALFAILALCVCECDKERMMQKAHVTNSQFATTKHVLIAP